MLSNDLVLKRINENTRNYRIRNEEICLKILMAPIDEKMRESSLRNLSCAKEID